MKKETFKFIDLFAGIGGFHVALTRNGMGCVFASEIDSHARKTYQENHNFPEELFNDDINKINPADIPAHDILCAGFPCQPFSQAGYKKGLNDERGNLFFNILAILKKNHVKRLSISWVNCLIASFPISLMRFVTKLAI